MHVETSEISITDQQPLRMFDADGNAYVLTKEMADFPLVEQAMRRAAKLKAVLQGGTNLESLNIGGN